MASHATSERWSTYDQQRAWFWCIETASLFVGIHLCDYPQSHEIAICSEQSFPEACKIFTEYINPYAATVIPPNTVSTLYYREVQLPPL